MNLISLRSATSFCYLDSNSPKINIDIIFDSFYNILHMCYSYLLDIDYKYFTRSR